MLFLKIVISQLADHTDVAWAVDFNIISGVPRDLKLFARGSLKVKRLRNTGLALLYPTTIHSMHNNGPFRDWDFTILLHRDL